MLFLQSEDMRKEIKLIGDDKVDDRVDRVDKGVSALKRHHDEILRHLLVAKSRVERPDALEHRTDDLTPENGFVGGLTWLVTHCTP